jgi:hypothetical protein
MRWALLVGVALLTGCAARAKDERPWLGRTAVDRVEAMGLVQRVPPGAVAPYPADGYFVVTRLPGEPDLLHGPQRRDPVSGHVLHAVYLPPEQYADVIGRYQSLPRPPRRAPPQPVAAVEADLDELMACVAAAEQAATAAWLRDPALLAAVRRWEASLELGDGPVPAAVARSAQAEAHAERWEQVQAAVHAGQRAVQRCAVVATAGGATSAALDAWCHAWTQADAALAPTGGGSDDQLAAVIEDLALAQRAWQTSRTRAQLLASERTDWADTRRLVVPTERRTSAQLAAALRALAPRTFADPLPDSLSVQVVP